ncbi:MAG: 1-acyl-sn-glycerol-3-phosphate acyltransferase [Rhodospirillaceae bacterium]|nr:1-acyl-sn-glycerol-3-phosphate acyltransferase [Rhodospirillaceae bacterium]
MALVRAIFFAIIFYSWTFLLCPLYVPLMILPRGYFRKATRFWVRGGFLTMKYGLGITHEIRGLENIPNGPIMIASKHQSMWDTQIYNLIFYDCIFVLKRSLLAVPLVGWFMWRAGMIAVDRRAGAAAMRKLLRDARTSVENGHTIVIFPEGTRMPPGERGCYQPGVAALYKELGLPVVPVALNSGTYWPRRAFKKRPGCIVLEFLPAIEPGLDRHDFMKELEEQIETATASLEQQANLQ